MGGFGWYLDKNHKHHHHAMSFSYFLIGVTSLFFVDYFISTSVFLAILSFLLSSLSFVYAVYHIKKQIKKNRLKKRKQILILKTQELELHPMHVEISLSKPPHFLNK